MTILYFFFFFSSRRRHTRWNCDWSSDVCSSDLASAAPPVRFANVYGIDMPTRAELIATGRNDEQVAREIGADAVIYQDLDALKDAVRAVNPKLTQFETSCFDGVYITGDITSEYLASIERQRDAGRQENMEDAEDNQLDLNAA